MDKMGHIKEHEKIRKIILLETEKNKKGDLFNRLAYDVFHALGFGEPRFNVPKPGREIDLVMQHRTENRVALVECKAYEDKVGGADVNKFVGALDAEREKYEQNNCSVVGYFISRSGFKGTVYEQEEERNKGRKERKEKLEMILLGPDGIVRELVQGHVICSLEQAVHAVRFQDRELHLCEQVDLLACEEGWIWVLYYARLPQQKATHFAFVHADGNQLLNSIADTILQRAEALNIVLSSLSYIEATSETIYNGQVAREAYFQYLKNELGEIQFEGMPVDKDAGAIKVDLEHIFVPIKFYDNDIDEEEGVITDKIFVREVLEKSLRAAVLAKPGGGKSTLIRRIALAYAYPERRVRVDDGLPDKDWLPVYIRCRDLENNATKSIMEMVSMIVQRAEITRYEVAFKNLVENALQNGQVLLLIDGLDEISNEKHRVCFANQLRTFVATYPGAHLLITSREAGFRAVAGTIATYCRQYSISGLEEEQIRLLSLKWHQAVLGDSRQVEVDSDKLCDIIVGDARIVALAENPLLLTTLLFVKRCVGYLPTKRCRLYEEMIRLLLVTWNAAAHDKLDMDETEPQLAFVAYYMMEQGQQKISREELKNGIIRARKELPEILDYTTVSPSKFIEQVEERSSLLIRTGCEENDMGQIIDFYEFSHLSFQEYLAAKAIVKQWVPDSRHMNLLKALTPHMEEEHWREVIPLAAFLSGRDAQPLMEELVRLNEEHENMDAKVSGYRMHKEGGDDIVALHLANCIANEVPVNQKLLKKGILLIIKRKRTLDEIQRVQKRRELSGFINVFDTIAKSKYGNSYREILRDELFHHYKDRYAYEYLDLWVKLFLLENEDGLNLENILSLLKSENGQEKVTGALLMMQSAFGSKNGMWKIGTRHLETGRIEDIFSYIYEMLNMEDDLSIYVSTWCIAWSGYGGANIIPHKEVSGIAERLVELWLSNRPPYLKRMISWGLAMVCSPELKLQKRDDLEAVIEDNFKAPQNDQDRRAAIHVAVITNQWSKKETRDRIKQIMSDELFYRIKDSRFLKEMKVISKSD